MKVFLLSEDFTQTLTLCSESQKNLCDSVPSIRFVIRSPQWTIVRM